MLSRDDIRRHLTSEVVFAGDGLPGFSFTIEHPEGLVLVDTGMIDTTQALEADGEEWHPRPLPDALVRRVAVVVNTHLHFDHCGGNRLFPGIPIHVQRRELADARTADDYTVEEWVRLSGRDVRRARRRGGDPAGRQAPAGAGTHGRTSGRRRGDRRRPGRPRRRRRRLVRGARTRGYAGPAARPRTRGADLPRACRGGACPAPAVVASSRPKAVP